jgi:CRP/FNR family transcriptional regulator, cyclic AMP receptor protein
MQSFLQEDRSMVALETLEKLDFLQGFPPVYLQPLAAVAEVVNVAADEVLFREGEKSPCIYLVISGKVALETWVRGNGATRIQTVGPGKMLGWTPILTQGPMTAQAVALEPCRLVAINAMQVLEACAENPRFGMEFMRRTAIALSRRLRATRQQLLDAYEASMPVMSE